ncbi:uncharacterized protein LOC124896169 [Capsicum annuum]|uniref:uncharacterized protein LOC124896169 n=1 Tax=Capsicum annuum TaxID=4072 RepID=UPI001FB096E9|nr:uncharacterized protein LOC124896169 [Capsicum annuum]
MDIIGIPLGICTHKIQLEEDCTPTIEYECRLNPPMQEIVKKEIIKWLDWQVIYPIFDSKWRCEEFNLVLNWEKCYFMVKEGIVLGHKILAKRIKVNRAKVEILDKEAKFTFDDDYKKAFECLKKKLVAALIIITLDWSMPFEIMCDASGVKLLAVVYAFEKFRTYLLGTKVAVYTDHTALRYLMAKKDAKLRQIRKCIPEVEMLNILEACHASPVGGHYAGDRTARKVLQSSYYWLILLKDTYEFVRRCDRCHRQGLISKHHEMPMAKILEVELFDVWGIDFMGPFVSFYRLKYILVAVDCDQMG